MPFRCDWALAKLAECVVGSNRDMFGAVGTLGTHPESPEKHAQRGYEPIVFRIFSHPSTAWLLFGAATLAWQLAGIANSSTSQNSSLSQLRLWATVCALGFAIELVASSARVEKLLGSGPYAGLRAVCNFAMYLGSVKLVVSSGPIFQLVAAGWLAFVVVTSSTSRPAHDALPWIDLATLWWALGFGYVRAPHEGVASALPWLGLVYTLLKLRSDSASRLARATVAAPAVNRVDSVPAERDAYASWVEHDSTLHDLSNAMTASLFMVRDLTRALEKGSEPNLRRALRLSQELAAELSQMSDHINTSRQSARWQPIAGSPVSLIDPVRRSVEHVSLLYPDVDCRVQCDVPEEQARINVIGGVATLKRIIENLVINACQALATVREKHVLCAIELAENTVSLTVTDNGPGFPQVILDLHPSPLVSTKSGGSGIGLYSCHELVKRDGGNLKISNREAGGARVTVSWPRAALSMSLIPNPSDSKIKTSGTRARPSDDDLNANLAGKV